MISRTVLTFLIFTVHPILVNSQVVFEDDFAGTTLDTSKWQAVTFEGGIRQDDELIFSKNSGSSDWLKNYVTSVESFSRSSESNVLRVTFKLRYENALHLSGLFPEGVYQNWVASMKYGFHENQESSRDGIYQIENGTIPHQSSVGELQPNQYRNLRITLDSVQGALWEIDLNAVWTPLWDTRGHTSGDTSSKYHLVIEFYTYAGGTLYIDNVTVEYVEGPPVTPTPTPDPAADWIQATPKAPWIERSLHSTCVDFLGKMWVIGGLQEDNYTLSSDVWSSVDGANWTEETPEMELGPRGLFGSVVYKDKIWIIGGFTPGSPGAMDWTNSDVWYSSDGATWNMATDISPWDGRAVYTTVVHRDKMWVIAGWALYGTTDVDVWYSEDGATWTAVSGPAPWHGDIGQHTSVVYDDKMWVIGGHRRSIPSDINEVWYSSDGSNWIQATAHAPWQARRAHCSVVYDNKMWVLGGFDSSTGGRSDVWYSTDGVNWTEATRSAEWPGRHRHAALTYNGRMWVLGGAVHVGFYDSKNDVWYNNAALNTSADFWQSY